METTYCTLGFTLIVVFLSVYVSEAKDLPNQGLLDDMPRNCSGFDYCLEPHADYPYKKIDELLRKKYHLTLGDIHVELVDRNEVDIDMQSDCEKISTYGPIYEIRDKNNNIRVVVQSEQMFLQQLRIERCLYPDERLLSEYGTEHFSATDLEENTIYCRQKTINYKFLVLTRDGEGFEYVRSKTGIPVCCTCKLEM